MMTQVCAERLKAAYEEEPDWDSNGDRCFPITQFTLFRAHTIISYLTSKVGLDRWIDPEIERGCDGEIDLVWETSSKYYLIYIDPSKEKLYTVSSPHTIHDPPRGSYNDLKGALEGLERFLGDSDNVEGTKEAYSTI